MRRKVMAVSQTHSFMSNIVIPETTVGFINGVAVALSGIYKATSEVESEGDALVDLYIQGVPVPAKKEGDIVEINGESWMLSKIAERENPDSKQKGQVTFQKTQQ